MTTEQLLENINKVVHEIGFGYIAYHELMGGIAECIKEYEDSNNKANEYNKLEEYYHKNLSGFVEKYMGCKLHKYQKPIIDLLLKKEDKTNNEKDNVDWIDKHTIV